MLPKVKAIPRPRRILFVGNSFTYFNGGLHAHLRELIEAADPGTRDQYVLRAITVSGAALSEHARALRDALRSQKWDVVVLQGRSTEPIEKGGVAGYRSAVRDFSGLARDAGARSALFLTWALEDRPELNGPLRESVTTVGNESDALVVPVGPAFERVRAENPRLVLYAPDRLHPSLAGTYLAACVFYGALFDESPVGLAYSARLPPDVARTLQAASWKTVQAFYGVPR